jgi:hypothetical protein
MAQTSTTLGMRLLLAVGLCCLAGGCPQSQSSDYREYSEIEATSSSGEPKEISDANLVENDETGDFSPGASDAIGNATANGQTTEPATDSGEVQVLIKEKQFKVEGPESALRVSYDDIDLLKVLNMDPVTPEAPQLMPKWLKDLDGKRIRIRGFMYPSSKETGLTSFALARDIDVIDFGRDPKIHGVFGVRLREGETTEYIARRPFDVVGLFHIRPKVEEGKLSRLYEMDDAVIVDDPENVADASPDSKSATASQTPPQTANGNQAEQKPPDANQSAEPRKVQVLVKERKFTAEGPESALRVSYDDIDLLKVLNMEPVTPDALKLMPRWLTDLDGQRIRIRGFMYPTYEETGLTWFFLARDNQICCFGRDPKIYDVFRVRLRAGETTDYLPNRPFDVVGLFHIRPEAEEGKLYQLYEMDDARIIEK